jgi:hypothetical protein
MKLPIPKIILTIFMSVLSVSAQSEAIWHCSRSIDAEEIQDSSSINESFNNLASFDESDRRTIEIQIIDLFQIYSGGTVSMGIKSLSACFLDRGNPLTTNAMGMLDIDPSSLTSLTNTDSIVKSQIIPTRNEAQMESCIAKNHPAIGYLSQVIETEQIGPCF